MMLHSHDFSGLVSDLPILEEHSKKTSLPFLEYRVPLKQWRNYFVRIFSLMLLFNVTSFEKS